MGEKRYIPALGFRWLTPLYDPLLKWIMREETFKRKLISQANIQSGMKVLDIARDKSRGTDIRWDEGLASFLPYPDSTFDRVVTSLVIHHLVTEDKRRAFKEIYRVLKPRGELHIIDFGAPPSPFMRFISRYIRLEETTYNFEGLIPSF